MTDPDTPSTNPESERSQRRLSMAALITAVVALIVAVTAVVVVLVRDDDDSADEAATTSTTSAATPTSTTTAGSTTTAPTSTTEAPSTSSISRPTSSIPAELSPAIWPISTSSLRFDQPVAAARSFAEEFIGFEDPIVGEFQQGDSRSGEVEIRAVEDGPTTVAFVRQLGPDDQWWVIGSATDNIVLTEPETLATVEDPITLVGQARAFEGTVNVAIYADGQSSPLAETIVTGRGDGVLGPFESVFEWPDPNVGWGALVLTTRSAQDGRILEAGAIRLKF